MQTDTTIIGGFQNELNPLPHRKSSGSKPAEAGSKGKVQGIIERVFSKSKEDQDVGSPLISEKGSGNNYGSCS